MNTSNLIYITTSASDQSRCLDNNVTICTLNAQSVRNKTLSLADFIQTEHVDICVITETWLKSDDDVVMGDLTPNGYTLYNHNRSERMGGGLAVIHNSNVNIELVECGSSPSYAIFGDFYSEWFTFC